VQGLRDALNGAEITADMVAPSTLGEKCWVRWPYLQVRCSSGITVQVAGLVRSRQPAEFIAFCPE
jgi:hypothetical protein